MNINVRVLNGNKALAFITCPTCGKKSMIMVNSVDNLKKWAHGEGYVQDMFPELNAEDRETLLSGWCLDCQNKVFKEEE